MTEHLGVEMAYPASASDEGVKYPAAMTAWYGLFCLLLCYFMFFIDRNILTLLVAPVRKDLGINDTQMGILNGYAFSVLNGLLTSNASRSIRPSATAISLGRPEM